MKLIINHYLNARRQPDTSKAAPYYRQPGYMLDVDDITVTGTAINGNPIWYHHAEDGCWYWSGGVEFTNELLTGRVLGAEELLIVYEAAVNELAIRYQHMPGFKGMAAGIKRKAGIAGNTPALIFYVDRKLAGMHRVPPVIHYRGIALDTDVHALGAVRLAGKVIEADALPPYMMGGSISDATAGNTVWGTRTLMVQMGGEDYLLTCYHVACHSLFAAKQYSTDGGVVKNVFPSPLRSPGGETYTGKVFMGAFGASGDFALVKPEQPYSMANMLPDYKFSGWYTKKELKAEGMKGITLTGYGAASETFSGKLIAYHAGSVEVDTELKLHMTGLIEAESMGAKGDSGAPVINQANKKLVGYVVAVGDTSTFIIPIATLIAKYSITPKIPS